MRHIALIAVVVGLALAQSYRCDWQVAATGGGMMSSDYRCGATIGQTATGRMSGQNLLALIGFWQPSGVTGIQERDFSQEGINPLLTRLYRPVPNPFARAVIIRYSLAREQAASLLVCDLSGRLVRTLVKSVRQPGAYTLHWNGRDNLGRTVPNGVYFCRFEAGDYRQTFKLLLQR